MNSIESITQKITDDANTAAKQKLLEATEEASAILKDFSSKAQTATDEIIKAAQKEASALLERVSSQAELAKRNLLLQYKREGIAKAFEQALTVLCEMGDEKKLAFLSSAALKYQTQDAEIILNSSEKAAFGDKLVAKINELLKASGKNFTASLSGKTGQFAGGMVLVEGSIETNCSYEILIKNIREELESDVAQALYLK